MDEPFEKTKKAIDSLMDNPEIMNDLDAPKKKRRTYTRKVKPQPIAEPIPTNVLDVAYMPEGPEAFDDNIKKLFGKNSRNDVEVSPSDKSEERLMLENRIQRLVMCCPEVFEKTKLPEILLKIPKMTDEELLQAELLFEYGISTSMSDNTAKMFLDTFASSIPFVNNETLAKDLTEDNNIVSLTKGVVSSFLAYAPPWARLTLMVSLKIPKHLKAPPLKIEDDLR